MTQRITAGLEPGKTEAEIGEMVRHLGKGVAGWRIDAGDVLVIDLDATADADAMLSKLKSAKGVRHAERDSWRSAF